MATTDELMGRVAVVEKALADLAAQAIAVLDDNAILLEDDAGAVKLHKMAIAASSI